MTKSTLRRTRKTRRCGSCHGWIEVNDYYLEQVMSPNHEGINGDCWSRMSECRACAARYGRGSLFPE